MAEIKYPYYFFKNGYIWLDDGTCTWQTHFKQHHMISFQSRRLCWFESVIEMNRDADYVMISEIIIRDKLYCADPSAAP